MKNRPKEFASDKLATSKPFSIGPNACLGKRLAWTEMRLLLARLVWEFDVSVDRDMVIVWSKLRAMMNVEKKPVFLRLKPASSTLTQ